MLGLVWGTHAEPAVRTRIRKSRSHAAGSLLFSGLRWLRQLSSYAECVSILIKAAAGINNAPLLELPTGTAGSGLASRLTAGLSEMSAQGSNLDALEIDASGEIFSRGGARSGLGEQKDSMMLNKACSLWQQPLRSLSE